MLAFFLLILLIKNSIGVTTDELKDELRLVRQEIGLLKVENKNQSAEIDLLKQTVELQNKEIDEKIEKEVNQKMKNCAGISNLSGMTAQERQPFRMIPFPFDVGKNKSCRLLATTSYDDVSKRLPSNTSSIKTVQIFYGQPTNCSDLSNMGYTLNGFYTVKPADHNNGNDSKLETIFCAFQQPEGGAFNLSAIEKRFAHLKLHDDGITSGNEIHFHGQIYETKFTNVTVRSSVLSSFEIVLNLGDAFNERNGTFTATKYGVYQFVFTMVMTSIPKTTKSTTALLVLKNRNNVDGQVVGRSSTKEAGHSMAIETTLKLDQDDQINVMTMLGAGYEIEWASFSGSLLKEL